MKTKDYLLFLFILALNCPAQTVFQKTFGDSLDEFGYSAIKTSDKGYLLAGFTSSYSGNNHDYILIKTDSTGQVTWSKGYGGSLLDEAYSVKQTKDGGYIIAGYTKSFGSLYYDALLIKTDANGDTLWSKRYGAAGAEYANTIIQTHDNGFIFAGYTMKNAIDTAQGSIYLVKTDANGNMQWEKALGPSKESTDAYDIFETTDKGYAITGYTNGFAESNGDVFLVKTDSMGNPLYSKTYGYAGYDWAYAVKQTSDGGFIIGGTYSTDAASLDMDSYIIKTDANGDTLWTRTYGGPGNELGQSLTQTSDGGYVIVGYTSGYGNGSYDMFMVKYNSIGDTVFARAFGGYNDDEANAIFECNNGSLVMAGQSNSFGNGAYDFYFMKTNPNGNSSCFQTDVHAASRNQSAVVNAVIMKQDTVTTTQVSVHPTVYNGILSFNACNAVGINLPEKSNELILFPNPNSGLFTIVSEKPGSVLTVTDVLGETVYQTTLKETKATVNLTQLAAGAYIVQLYNEGKIHNGKILVNK